MMIITTLPNHFALELVGSRRVNRSLRIVSRKLDNPDFYFGQFNYPAAAKAGLVMGEGLLGRLAVITPGAQQELSRRFPNIADHYPTHINLVGDFGPALGFPATGKYFRVEDVLLANALSGMVRIRHMRFALLITKDATTAYYRSLLDEALAVKNDSELVAMQVVPAGKAEVIIRAAQFANVFLMNGLHETSIGAFIDQHREILLSALEARELVPEPHLPWVVPSPDPDEHAINPDLFVQRGDGYWDVYDLKLALINRKDLATGKRRRRRFVATIEDGIAQLAHYREFLSIPEHAALAEEKYNARFNDPRFVLVVGNYENVNAERVAEARRRFPDLELIDYDSLLQLYVMREDALPI